MHRSHSVELGEKIVIRFVVLAVVKMSMVVFWVVTLCEVGGGYRRFGPEDGDRIYAAVMAYRCLKVVHCVLNYLEILRTAK
jgi:hypothetical protein